MRNQKVFSLGLNGCDKSAINAAYDFLWTLSKRLHPSLTFYGNNIYIYWN